jgi:hypothetical protein
MKYLIIIAVMILLYPFYFGCVSPTLKNPIFISYTSDSFSPTNTDDIEIFESRFDLVYRYVQIGVIKYDKDHNKEILIEMAAGKGAHVIIFEDDNVVLFRYVNKEDENEKIPVKTIRYNFSCYHNISKCCIQ